MERTVRSQNPTEGIPHQVKELPVKVDIVEGADGLELHEIVFALQYTANDLRSSDLFRAMYLERLVAKYQSVQRNRFMQIKQYFQERFLQGYYSNNPGITNKQDHP